MQTVHTINVFPLRLKRVVTISSVAMAESNPKQRCTNNNDEKTRALDAVCDLINDKKSICDLEEKLLPIVADAHYRDMAKALRRNGIEDFEDILATRTIRAANRFLRLLEQRQTLLERKQDLLDQKLLLLESKQPTARDVR